MVDRDLEDSKQPVSADSQFNIAYNAALQLCAILLLVCAEYRYNGSCRPQAMSKRSASNGCPG